MKKIFRNFKARWILYRRQAVRKNDTFAQLDVELQQQGHVGPLRDLLFPKGQK